MLTGVLEVINLGLITVGGVIGFSVLRSFRGGTMASAVLWLIGVGGVFAIHELSAILFRYLWPQPWVETVYTFTETAFLIVLIIGVYKLRQAVPRGV